MPEQTPQPEAAAPSQGATPPPSNAGQQAPEQPPQRSLEELLAEAQGKLEEHRTAWLRAVADAENARKRAQADVANAHKYAVDRIAESLLPVIDSLEAALAAGNASAESLRNGVELTLKQLQSAFERARISELTPAPGDKFDPHRHHAVAAVESDAEPNTVVGVMQKGYSLHDRVIRPALVTVAKARQANDA